MITVTFADGCLLATASKSLWQYDYGQQLEIVGLDLPEVFQVDFCNSGDTSTITVLGENNVVSIPDQFILDGRGITAFCFVYDETTGGTTRAEMKLPVLPRPERTEEQPDPEQEHVIDQLISELGENVEDAEAWAVGERDGVPVSEGDPTYNNSAKYWAGKAMTDAPVTSVNGKAGDIVLDLDDIPNGEQYARTTPAQIQQIGTNAADIADVEELIPAEASAGNQLADKYFVNNEIQTNSAHFRGAWSNWFAVPTDRNQYPADNKGVKTPSANDYIVVLDASGYPAGQTILSGTWRFSYVGSWEMSGRNGWKNEYQVNETALHTEQIAAINAKIPSQASASNQLADKNLVNTKLMAYRTAADQDAIDSAQDARVAALQTTVNGKQTKITANGILKGNGNGGISAAVAGIDYLPTSALAAYRSANAQDAIDNAQDQNINKNTAAINTMQPAATATDIGKALIVKTVADGKPTSYEYGEAGGGGSAPTAGDGINITNDVISNTQGIEYIVGTQAAATSKWTGSSTDETLKVGKIIAYYLPFAGTSTAATLALTMGNGTTTREISLQLKPGFSVTTNFPAGSIIILVYDGTYWRVNASYDTDTNTYTTGYCVTSGAVAAKTASCTFGYRGDANYFPCLFRFANTATDATLAITTYAPEAAPIYVNGARTSTTNTFSAGVILFLYYNGAYYCYNDGRFPILVDGAVTSVQEYAAGLLVNYRTAADQDTIDSEQDERIEDLEQTTTATTIGPSAIATFDASAANMPLKGLTVNIEPVQAEGTPSPENPLPITGWTGCKLHRTGVSLIGGDAFLGYAFAKTDSGYELTYGGSGVLQRGSAYADITGLPAGRYTLQFINYTCPDSCAVTFRFRSPGGSWTTITIIGGSAFGRRTFTMPANTAQIQFYFSPNTGASVGDKLTADDVVLMREEGNETPELYKGNTYDITFPSEAGTVYSGTLDILTGIMTVNALYCETNAEGKLQWYLPGLSSTPANCAVSGNYAYYTVWTSSIGVSVEPFSEETVQCCNRYTIEYGGASAAENDNSCKIRKTSNYARLTFKQTNMPGWGTASDIEAYFAENPLQVLIPLSEPLQIQLSPIEVDTLLNQNNIWADCGDVTVTYGAYLETLKASLDRTNSDLANLRACIAPTEDGDTASQAYVQGAYFFRNGSFCVALLEISSGDQFTLGTNYKVMSVAEAILAMSFAILEQPHDVEASIGVDGTFSVVARGAAGYVWQYWTPNSQTWRDSSTTTSDYTLEVTEVRYTYRYRCKVTGLDGSVIYSQPVKYVRPS